MNAARQYHWIDSGTTPDDGMQALAVARGFAPQVAVLDLGLPLIDGYELAASLQSTSATGPIRLIAVTGYGQIEDRKRTQAAGFARHLVKPVDLDELEAALTDVAGLQA